MRDAPDDVTRQAAQIAERVTGIDPLAAVVDDDAQGRKAVQIKGGPDAIRTLRQQITEPNGLLDDVYVRNGDLVHLGAVSGGLGAGGPEDDAPLPFTASVLNPALLAGLLAEQCFVYQVKSRGKAGAGEVYPEEVTPQGNVLAAVLAGNSWGSVLPFTGIIGAPILRRDGTLLQRRGYDRSTGLVLASRVPLDPVPDEPTPAQVVAARDFLLTQFLRDFLWVDTKADRANYIALLVTPILRSFTRCVTPFGVVTATQPASGKTILTGGPGLLYGQRMLPWPYDDVELRKAVTSVLQESVGVVVFDNIAEGTVIDSAVLAQLVTAEVWSDRVLGSTRTIATPNERLWLATGNNLRLGGDMTSRSVLVRLDPNMPHPETRTGFAIGDLQEWITNPSNQRVVLWHLLILVVSWTRAGAPRATQYRMRQFTPWAQALGGFLEFHGIEGFLANAADVKGIDEDEARWGAFLARWHERLGGTPVTATKLRTDAEPTFLPGVGDLDPWDGSFITLQSGRLPNPIGLGRMLTGQVGRWRGEYVLRSAPGQRGDRATFWVEMAPDAPLEGM